MPIFSLDELKQAVVGGKIGAISIDTTIFEQYQFGFEMGVLAQMAQFGRLDADHLVFDTILHEIRSHLVTQADLNKAHVKNSLKPLGNSWGIERDVRDKAMSLLFEDQAGKDRTQDRIETFVNVSSATTLACADYVNLSDLLARYFDTRPPFGDKEAKKREFPDALTLMAIESWAAKNRKQVITVSKDGDWKRFCAESELVFFVDNLPEALSVFHVGADDALHLFKVALAQGVINNLDVDILEAINSQADKIEVEIEACANWYYEAELDQVNVSANPPFTEQLKVFEVINYEDNQLELRTTVQADVTAQFVASFQQWDGIDKDYMSMGSATVEKTEVLELELIISVEFTNGQVALQHVELLPYRTTMDFGEIEPDWMGEYQE